MILLCFLQNQPYECYLSRFHLFNTSESLFVTLSTILPVTASTTTSTVSTIFLPSGDNASYRSASESFLTILPWTKCLVQQPELFPVQPLSRYAICSAIYVLFNQKHCLVIIRPSGSGSLLDASLPCGRTWATGLSACLGKLLTMP